MVTPSVSRHTPWYRRLSRRAGAVLGITLLLGTTISSVASANSPQSGGWYPLSTYHGQQPTRADLAATHKKGTVVFGDWMFPDSLSPWFAGVQSSFEVMDSLWANLIGLDNQSALYPDLASQVPSPQNGQVRINPSGTCTSVKDESHCPLIVTVTLRSNLMWSDGQPLTTKDIVYSWKTLMDPATGAYLTNGYDQILDVQAKDTQTVVFYWKSNFGPFIWYLPPVLPQHVLGKIPDGQLHNAPFWQMPNVTSGPYYAIEYKANDHITLARNPRYAAWENHKAYYPQVKFAFYPDKNSQILAVQQGGKAAPDVTEDYTYDDIAQLQQAKGVNVPVSPAPLFEQLTFNMSNPLFKNNPEVRTAIAMATDRMAIALNIAHAPSSMGQSVLANTPEFPTTWDYNAGVQPPSYDPSGAQMVMGKNGWKKNSQGWLQKGSVVCQFNLGTTEGNTIRAAEAAYLQNQMKALGCNLTPQYYPASLFFDGNWADQGILEHGLFDVAMFAWGNGLDGDWAYPIFHSSQIPTASNPTGENYGRVQDPQLDAALAGGRATADFPTRYGDYQTYQQLVISDLYMLPLYYRGNISTVRTGRMNFVQQPMGYGYYVQANEWNVGDWFLKAGK